MSTTTTGSIPTHGPARTRSPLAIHPHLTGRDRAMLALLDDHQVLTADQLARTFFTHLRTCQLRLNVLRGLDLLDRFRFARPYGGTEPWKWVLGTAGARFQAAATGRAAPTDRAHREHLLRLSANPALGHLLTVNEFFARLHHPARSTPTAARPGQAAQAVRVQRWWSERTATARFPGIQPDGHGLWTAHGATVGYFLEVDLGSENLARLVGKLPGYARLAAAGGPTYPVLFWLGSPEREANLQQLLRADPPQVPVATATHDTDPASAVWLPVDGWQRLRLDELPCDHGPHVAGNPNWVDGRLDLSDQTTRTNLVGLAGVAGRPGSRR
jgi:hypothetical protein